MPRGTSGKIIEYISQYSQASGKELADYLEITDRAVRKQLKKMLEEGQLVKVGVPPKVYYRIAVTKGNRGDTSLSDLGVVEELKNYIEENYLNITPAGERRAGWEGFVSWCDKTGENVVRMAHDYVSLMRNCDKFKNSEGLISGMNKLTNTFPMVWLDELFYIDFYSIERFGKTKLGQLLLYAKQSQNKKLIKELAQTVKYKAEILVRKFQIDGIGYIPPTVKREVQLMKELHRYLNFPIRTMSISKIKTEVVVPQKTLNKLDDRIENAKKTFVVEDITPYRNILLIDDAVGSGATLNEIARMIKEKNICTGKIIALAITGSFKGFDVISEV